MFSAKADLRRRRLRLLLENRPALDRLAQYLYEHETITGEEFMHILQ